MPDSTNSTGIARRGFASMTPEKRRKIASKGGSASGGNFKHDREKARRAGRLGGLKSRKNQGHVF